MARFTLGFMAAIALLASATAVILAIEDPLDERSQWS